MTAGFLDVNGARLWYEKAGSGPALVMLHGQLIDSGQWDGQVAAFAPEFRVVRYDARGLGRSDKPATSFAFFEDLRRGSAATWTAPSSLPCRYGPTGSAGVRSRSTPRPMSASAR